MSNITSEKVKSLEMKEAEELNEEEVPKNQVEEDDPWISNIKFSRGKRTYQY
jgi:hypothetical protein